uniref:vascular-related unknown protein 1-like n=1 Tax=Erigeron canadensis TaxID=72917 RepID=UPI001CB8C0C8|nr:vascular-related unknown protein 1-like [Erigeron canadensis]
MDLNHSSYSYTNSMTKSVADTDTLTTEESGWTSYFEDFMVAQQQDHHQTELSDAGSYADWNNIANSMNGAAPRFPKKLNLIKKSSRRTRDKILYDDSLEDTASSPVNSPKVGSPQMGFNQIKVDDDIMQNSLEKEGGFDGHFQLLKREDQSRNITYEENNNGRTDLRKRGLCLVPLSMFVNYI